MKPGDNVRTRVHLQSRAEPIRVHPVGSDALVVERLGDDAYLVEIRVPDDRFVGNAWYESYEVHDHELEYVAEEVDGAA